MNPEDIQQQSVDMTPEEAKASLGLATRLSEQMLMAQMGGGMQPEAPQDAQNGQGEGLDQENGDSGETPKTDNGGDNMESDKMDKSEEKMDGKMEILRTELKDTIKVEIDSIKEMIKEALNNEQD